MQERKGCDEGRRRFLRDMVRYPALGALGLVAVGLATREEPLHPDAKCASAEACRQCPAYERCRLPQAELARQASDGT